MLLLGPIYHLGDREERRQALIEARRICRPGGLVFVAAISRLAPLLDALRLGALDDRTMANVRGEVETGRRVEMERRGSAFPDAYFHLPSERAGEVAAGGLGVECVFGVEGPGWLARDFDCSGATSTRASALSLRHAPWKRS